MNSGVYITELKGVNPEKNINTNNDEPNELKEINENFTLSSTKNDEVTLEKSKHNILDYLIREETTFADLYKVEKYYKNILIQHSKKYNQTNDLIKDKMKEIEYVQDLINREIIANIDLDKTEMLELYRIEKERLQNGIEQYELDKECYQHIYERQYRNNVFILSKLIS